MKMVHVEKTPDGSYMIVDATGAPAGGASFAPTATAYSEEQLRSALKAFGFTDKAIDQAIEELKTARNTTLQL
jgi:Holliday junction resolvasome RuvABC DNA-binding subunit